MLNYKIPIEFCGNHLFFRKRRPRLLLWIYQTCPLFSLSEEPLAEPSRQDVKTLGRIAEVILLTVYVYV